MKNKGLIFHSAKMFYLNFKGYSMLAITIVLSFAILLGYMVFSDSMTYNNFKHVFASPSNALLVETQDGLKDILMQKSRSGIEKLYIFGLLGIISAVWRNDSFKSLFYSGRRESHNYQ